MRIENINRCPLGQKLIHAPQSTRFGCRNQRMAWFN
ncbi:MAG: hypothetical protein JWM89_2530 [Acidimicrobiales bacterium]|nr:hypothetical protein [Acidimicrobiales bacterium]